LRRGTAGRPVPQPPRQKARRPETVLVSFFTLRRQRLGAPSILAMDERKGAKPIGKNAEAAIRHAEQPETTAPPCAALRASAGLPARSAPSLRLEGAFRRVGALDFAPVPRH